MKKIGTIKFGSMLLVAGSLAIWPACNSNTPAAPQDPVDSAKAVNKEVKPVAKDASDFAVMIANAGMTEIRGGQLAQEKSTNPRVKAFGEMMVKDHTAAGDKLKGIAQTENIALPDSLGTDSWDELDMLGKKSGRDFDKSYMDMMEKGHTKVLEALRKYIDGGSDSALRSFATAVAPTVQMHLDSAKAIGGAIRK